MSAAALPEYAIYAAIAVFVIYRQLAPRPVRGAGAMFVLPLLLAGYGAYALLQSPPAATTYLLLGGELVIAAGAGVVRGLTIRFWTDASRNVMQRGTWLTLVVWVLFIGLRVAGDLLFRGAFATPELLLSVGASLLVQAVVTYLRGQALLPQGGRQPQPGVYR